MSEIKVVPCWANLEGKFHLRVGDKDVPLAELGRVCGTEAEALAKKAELEANQESSDFCHELLTTNLADRMGSPELRSTSPYAYHAPNSEPIEQARPQPRGGFVSGQIFEVRATCNEHELLIAANSTQEALIYAEFIDPEREYKTAETFVGRQVWMKR